jgi:hypothetical protein
MAIENFNKFKKGDKVEILFNCSHKGKRGRITEIQYNVAGSKYIEVEILDTSEITKFRFPSSLKLISDNYLQEDLFEL